MKYLNDENHSEYEALGLPAERIKQNIKNWTIDYDHTAKKDSPQKFSTIKLEEVELNLLPEYIQKNHEKFKNWVTK